MKKISLKTFIQNLYSLWTYDYHREDNRLSGNMIIVSQELKWLKIQNAVLHAPEQYADYPELKFVLSASDPTSFPYRQVKPSQRIEVKFDEKLGMPYVHYKDKRLYYPKEYPTYQCERAYRNLIEKDQIIEGGYLEKAPHCYQTDTFKVNSGDVLVDGGAAEGLFALAVIDKISHVYIVEASKIWIPALQATFSPYREKVTIINKYLSDKNDRKNVSLVSLLEKHSGTCFVKMDIEGAEKNVIKSSQGFLKERDNVRLACCTYHFQDDAKLLSQLFDEIGYKHMFSDGWMIFTEYDNPQPPYLRHGLIYASASL